MKAEHRKELQTNTLADHLGRWIQGLRDGMKSRPTPSTVVVLIFVFLALVVFIGWRYYSNSQQRERSQLWLELDQARSAADVDDIASKHEKTTPGQVARFEQARVLLQNGAQKLFDNITREEALKNLDEAEKAYAELIPLSKDRPLLIQEAMLGVAKCREARGDLEGARKAYEELAKTAEKYPHSAHGQQAAEQLKQLEKPEVQKFYAKLNDLVTAKSKPAASLPDWLPVGPGLSR